jgi:hypothetical protein
MITSNAGAEFSIKTTIIVVLGWQPLENAADQATEQLFCAPAGALQQQLSTGQRTKIRRAGPAHEIFPRPRNI